MSKTWVFTLLVGLAAALSGESPRQDPPVNSDVRLFRVILPVGDIERASNFYARLLAMPGERVSPGRHYFPCGETILALVDPRADGDDWEARPNQDHVYFAVPDLESVRRRALELGGLSEEMGDIEKRPWGEISFYMRDPFGNPLAFVDRTTLFTGNRR